MKRMWIVKNFGKLHREYGMIEVIYSNLYFLCENKNRACVKIYSVTVGKSAYYHPAFIPVSFFERKLTVVLSLEFIYSAIFTC